MATYGKYELMVLNVELKATCVHLADYLRFFDGDENDVGKKLHNFL